MIRNSLRCLNFTSLVNNLTKQPKCYFSNEVVNIRFSGDTLELDVKTSPSKTNNFKFNALWLRFNCHSPNSRQLDSNQRIIDVEKIPLDLTIKNCKSDNENLYIDWHQDNTKTSIPIKHLLDNYPQNPAAKSFQTHEGADLTKFDYLKFFINEIKNEDEIQRWMNHLLVYGVNLIKNVPVRDQMVLNIAKLIAPVQHTIYGDCFDVLATPNPINIAYSNTALCLHMDLMYYESAPGLQFLHCIKNDSSVRGGESVLLDSFLAAKQFREQYPNYFKTLTRIPATFQKIHFNRERPVYMVYKRPHIVLNNKNEIIAVNWSPPFEGPLTGVSQSEIKDYYESYISFTKFMNNHPAKKQYLLKPGDVLCFNNRRVLHARNGFELNGGMRHLQGCYVNIDEFKSEVVYREYKSSTTGTVAGRDVVVGNHDYNDAI